MMVNGRSATREQLLRAIEGGEHLPDQFLPIGIHRISTTRYRALLCTGGHKFKGPGRELIKEALEDRRKLCEQTGVDFVIYGKQTHVKGERPVGWQNAAVYEDGTTSVPVVPGRTVPKELSEVRSFRAAPVRPQVQPVSQPTFATTVSGRVPSTETQGSVPVESQQWTAMGESGEELVCTRRKSPYPEFKLSKKDRKYLLTSAQRNGVYAHPYNLLRTDIAVSSSNEKAGLAPVAIQVIIDDKSVNDQFLWSVHAQDDTALEVYLRGLLLDAGILVTHERIQYLRKVVDDQLAAFRSAVLFQLPDIARAQPVSPTGTVQVFLDKVRMSAYTDDQVAKEFAQVYAAEHGISDASSVLWQVIDQCVSQRAADQQQEHEELKSPPRASRSKANKSR